MVNAKTEIQASDVAILTAIAKALKARGVCGPRAAASGGSRYKSSGYSRPDSIDQESLVTKPLLTSTSPPPDEELNPWERAAEAVLRTGSNLLQGSIESKRMLMLILMLMSNAAPAFAGPFEDALAAY